MAVRIATDGAPRPVGPYSQALLIGDTLYVSGQIGLDPNSGQLVEGGLVAQARQALANLSAILHAAGLTMGQVARTTVFLADLDDFPRVNEVYAEAFRDPYPARSTVQVSGLPAGALIEIDAIAVRGPA